jgi:hypothetical protein
MACKHVATLGSMALELRSHFPVDFEAVISCGERCMAEVASALQCPLCSCSPRTVAAMPRILQLVLARYEACCEAYSIRLPDRPAAAAGPGGSTPGADDAGKGGGGDASFDAEGRSLAAVCYHRSPINLGQINLTGDDAKLFINVVVQRRLRAIGGLLRQVRDAVSAMCLESSHELVLRGCDAALSTCEDQVHSLMGLLN